MEKLEVYVDSVSRISPHWRHRGRFGWKHCWIDVSYVLVIS